MSNSKMGCFIPDFLKKFNAGAFIAPVFFN